MFEDAYDAPAFARRHAGEEETDLTATQRNLLGRVVAKRLEQGISIRLIERAVARALPHLDVERAHWLARYETLRAITHEQLADLHRSNATRVLVSAAAGACEACTSRAGVYAIAEVPSLPHRACLREGGCRCVYRPAEDA